MCANTQILLMHRDRRRTTTIARSSTSRGNDEFVFALLDGHPLRALVLIAAMWTPGAAALLVTWRAGDPIPARLGLTLGRWPWLLASIVAPVGLYLLMLAWGLALLGIPSPQRM